MKKINRLALVFAFFLVLCGFKSNTTLNIDKNKNLSVEVNMMLSEKEIENEDTHLKMSTNATNYEKNGFKVITVNKDSYSGYKITKYLGNIDKLSEHKTETVYISDLLEKDFNNTLLFKHEKSFFKDIYTANYKYQFYEGRYLGEIGDNYLISAEEEKANTEEVEDNNMSEIMGEVDPTEIVLVVELPFKSNSNNASVVSEDKKTLTWNINYLEENTINYSFVVYNVKSILIVGAGSFFLMITLFIILIILHRKKATREMLIHTDYDPSIVGMIPETMTGTIPTSSGSLEVLDTTSTINTQNIEQ